MAATRACFGGTRHQSAHHEEEEEDKGSLRQCSGLLHHFPPPPGLAFPAPASLLCTGAASALHRAARLLLLAGLNPLSLSLAVGRRTCLVLG